MSAKEKKFILSKLTGIFYETPCFIIGNAPSLLNINLTMVEPFLTIGINRSYRAIKTSFLMWQDPELMKDCRVDLERFDGVCVCTPKADPGNKFSHFVIRGQKFHKSSNPSVLHGRGSTGPLAVQFAAALGCKPIFLLGMDCILKGRMTDFYGNNRDWKPHTPRLCANGLKWIFTNFTQEEVQNLSPHPEAVYDSTRKFYKYAIGREKYLSMIRKRSSSVRA
jgi:hypothetical protein